jgi:hypothetical protein
MLDRTSVLTLFEETPKALISTSARRCRCTAAVLPLHTHGLAPLFEKASLIHDEHTLIATQLLRT